MVSRRVTKALLSLFPLIALALFVYQMVRIASLQVWAITDIIIITYASGQFLRGILLGRINQVNKEAIEKGDEPILGKTWQFTGFFFGILIAGLASAFFSKAIESPSTSFDSVVVLTIEAIAIVILSFVAQFYPPRTKRRIRLRWPSIGFRAWWSRRHWRLGGQ